MLSSLCVAIAEKAAEMNRAEEQMRQHWVLVAAQDIRTLVQEFERMGVAHGLPDTLINAFRRLRELLLREGVYPESAYVRAQMRPSNFYDLPPEEQWSIDKQLGILDWDGSDDRALSNIPIVEGPSPDTRVSPMFQGMHPERYNDFPEELDAALLWEAENTQASSLAWKVGARVSSWAPSLSLLGRLLSRDPDRGVNPSPRDWIVASTVVQWLGSMRGRTFLAQLQLASSQRDDR
jgi:hypothetical protein